MNIQFEFVFTYEDKLLTIKNQRNLNDLVAKHVVKGQYLILDVLLPQENPYQVQRVNRELAQLNAQSAKRIDREPAQENPKPIQRVDMPPQRMNITPPKEKPENTVLRKPSTRGVLCGDVTEWIENEYNPFIHSVAHRSIKGNLTIITDNS